jgi:hypothetical protein
MMNKRSYKVPTSRVYALMTEGMMATSAKISNEARNGTVLTNRHGWDASNWAGEDSPADE